MTNDDRDIRFVAQSMYSNANNMYRQYPSNEFSRSQTHSINLYTEDFLAGFMQDGRMSVVRRFFCLFVTFDLFFIALLWLICILITGDDIYNALKTQILQYTIHKSLFDIVMAAICRFAVLLLFYALLYINHWIIIALSTSGSCAFLIYKVFVYNWVDSHQPMFEVLLIVTSFVLAWGEAWFLDCRVIPQERHARNYITAVTPNLTDDRSPLMAPFLNGPAESVANFYSPYDSIHNSDDEDEQDEDFKNMGKECVRRATDLLESSDWKMEKLTSSGDTIKSTNRPKLGKVWRLTARLQFPAKSLSEHLFYKIEDISKWNPTILESKILRKIDDHTDISYQATAGAAGGIVKSRDFVNLRCWHLCRNGLIVDPSDYSALHSLSLKTSANHDVDNTSDDECILSTSNEKPFTIQKSVSEVNINEGDEPTNLSTLSKSLGAKGFFEEDVLSKDGDTFVDAEGDNQSEHSSGMHHHRTSSGNMYVSSAISIPYASMPLSSKYIRGENLLSCWAMREIDEKHDSCIFEWLLCLDLKGYFPRYVLDSAYTTLMQDYMGYLRKYCVEQSSQ